MTLGILPLIVTTMILVVMVLIEKKETPVILLIASAAISYFVGLEIINMNEQSTAKPTALDVYRERTTLQVTYEDSMAVDSVVVYK